MKKDYGPDFALSDNGRVVIVVPTENPYRLDREYENVMLWPYQQIESNKELPGRTRLALVSKADMQSSQLSKCFNTVQAQKVVPRLMDNINDINDRLAHLWRNADKSGNAPRLVLKTKAELAEERKKVSPMTAQPEQVSIAGGTAEPQSNAFTPPVPEQASPIVESVEEALEDDTHRDDATTPSLSEPTMTSCGTSPAQPKVPPRKYTKSVGSWTREYIDKNRIDVQTVRAVDLARQIAAYAAPVEELPLSGIQAEISKIKRDAAMVVQGSDQVTPRPKRTKLVKITQAYLATENGQYNKGKPKEHANALMALAEQQGTKLTYRQALRALSTYRLRMPPLSPALAGDGDRQLDDTVEGSGELKLEPEADLQDRLHEPEIMPASDVPATASTEISTTRVSEIVDHLFGQNGNGSNQRFVLTEFLSSIELATRHSIDSLRKEIVLKENIATTLTTLTRQVRELEELKGRPA